MSSCWRGRWSTNHGRLLFRLACEYLISARVIRPGQETVVRRVAHARAQAQRETYDRLAQEFTP